jgi:hypothetical protein
MTVRIIAGALVADQSADAVRLYGATEPEEWAVHCVTTAIVAIIANNATPTTASCAPNADSPTPIQMPAIARDVGRVMLVNAR